MNHKVLIDVTRDLEVLISHPSAGIIKFRLDRISAQHFARSLNAYSTASRDVGGLVHSVFGELVTSAAGKQVTGSVSVVSARRGRVGR